MSSNQPEIHAEKLDLISSAQVRGTQVYGADKQEVGTIDHLIIDKPTGKIVYAVMAFGGFLGVGEHLYPIPWEKLKYDTAIRGYATDLTGEQIKGASESVMHLTNGSHEREHHEGIHRYYGLAYPWGAAYPWL